MVHLQDFDTFIKKKKYTFPNFKEEKTMWIDKIH
jgi:hypothetical protein